MHRLPQPSPQLLAQAQAGSAQARRQASPGKIKRWRPRRRCVAPSMVRRACRWAASPTPAVLDRDHEANAGLCAVGFPAAASADHEAESARRCSRLSRFAVASGGLLSRQDKELPAKAAIVVVAPGFVGCQRPKRRKRGRVRPRPLRPRAVGLYRAPVGRATEPPARKASASRPVRVTIPPAASRRRQMRGSDGLLCEKRNRHG